MGLEIPFTPVDFIKQPRVILKITILFISVVALGVSANGCIVKHRFAIAVQLLGFLFALASICTDYMYSRASNVKRRRYILLSDIVGTSVFAFLNFAAFCFLASVGNARSAVIFCIVAMLFWIVLTIMAVLRFRSSGQGLLAATLPPDLPGEPQSGVADDDMYPKMDIPRPGTGGPMPAHQQQPMDAGDTQYYHPPPTF